MAFSAETRHVEDGQYVLLVGGGLDLRDAARLKRLLFDVIEAGAREIQLDLTGIAELDPPAVGVLILAENALQRAEGRLVLVSDNPARLDRLAGMEVTRIFDVQKRNGSH